jgi:nudix-type nucleoside diphosphatase (YffH/AdpP family)
MRVDIQEVHEEYRYKHIFRVLRARLRHEKFDGTLSEEVERVAFESSNSVGVLLYDEDHDAVLLTRQFRYPAYMNDGPGWLIEIVAGRQDHDQDALTVARNELIEEIGYEVDQLQFLCQCYLSPGANTETIRLYLGYLKQARRVNAGGGLASEHEDIQLVTLPMSQALQMIRSGEICDAKTILALQQLFLYLSQTPVSSSKLFNKDFLHRGHFHKNRVQKVKNAANFP